VPDPTYKPANDLDRENWAMYDPGLFEGMPVCLQLVGRSMFEERLLGVGLVVDQAIRDRPLNEQ
jgi:amidase